MINLAYVEHGIAKTDKFNFETGTKNKIRRASTLDFKGNKNSLLDTIQSKK